MTMALRQCHFPFRWNCRLGRNTTAVAVYRSHCVTTPSVPSAGVASSLISSWSLSSIAIGEGCVISSIRSAGGASTFSEGRQSNNILQYLVQSRRWNSSSRNRKGPDMRNCRSIEELVKMAHDHLKDMSPRDVAAFWTIVPRFLQTRDRSYSNNHNRGQGGEQMNNQFDTILGHTLEAIKSFGYRDLAQTTLAFAKIVKRVDRRGERLQRGSPQQILHDLTIGGNNSENKQFLFDALATASMPILRKFDARSLSNFIYAFGLAEYELKFEDGSTLFDVLALEAIANLKKFNSHDMSNMLWAYANMRAPNPQLFKEAGDTIVARGNLDEFEPQHLSNIVWAYATLDEKKSMLLKKVADHIIALDHLDEFKPQNLSNLLWAHATLEEKHPKLFKKVADHIIARDTLMAFKPQELSNIVWAYATADASHPKLSKKVADHIIALDNLRSFIPQGLANTVWAYATAKEPHHTLFQKVAAAAISRQQEFNPQDTANFLWAHSANGYIDKHLFQSWESTAASTLGKCNSQELANIAWAYAVADVAASSLFNADFINACLEREEQFTLENLCQLHQWQLWQEELKSNFRLPKSLQQKCHEAFLSRVPRPSTLQDDVISELKSIGLQPEEEVLTERGYLLDAIVEVNGFKIGIEVDGPTHFLGRKPTGSTILKHRQVSNLEGIPVVSVPYWEWNKLGNDKGGKQQYLRVLLDLK